MSKDSQPLVRQHGTDGASGDEGDRSVKESREKQRDYALQVSELVKAIQGEAGVVVKVPTEALGPAYTAAYLASDAIVVMFDIYRNMTSKPLRDLSTDAIISIVEAGTPELLKMIEGKRSSEISAMNLLERMAEKSDVAFFTANRAMGSQTHPEPRGTEPFGGLPSGTSVEPHAEKEFENLPDVDRAILNAVDKGLEFLGRGGRGAILGLLESRYGLRLRDVPEHPRSFIELLVEVVGNSGHVIEREIISELSKSYSVQGRTLDQVIRSLKSQLEAGNKERAEPAEVADAGARQNIPEKQKAEAPGPAVEPSSTGGEVTVGPESPKPEEQSSDRKSATPADAALVPYELSFTIKAPFIPINQFLQDKKEHSSPGAVIKPTYLPWVA